VFHLFRNIEKVLGSFLGGKNTQFLRDFRKIRRTEDENSFEKDWEEFLKKYIEGKSQKNRKELLESKHNKGGGDVCEESSGNFVDFKTLM